MNTEIITEKFQMSIYGFGDTATNKDYVGTAYKLSGRMWEVVKTNRLKNKGKNVWVYETNDIVFAGVELDNPVAGKDSGLIEKKIILENYACFKHIGPYQLIKQTGRKMKDELTEKGFEVILPYIEIYGHWNKDETRLETELLMCLR